MVAGTNVLWRTKPYHIFSKFSFVLKLFVYEGKNPGKLFFYAKKMKSTKNSFDRNYFRKLNPSVPNAPFLYPWKHQKTFSGVEKGYIGNEWVK